jgi:hypothetical protein
MAQYYDRYQEFRTNGEIKPIPGIILPIESNDKYILYRQGNTRLDKLSNLYYNNPYSGWLIMLANPEFGGLEFNIPDSTLIRIPYPFESAVGRYITQITNHKLLYGE